MHFNLDELASLADSGYASLGNNGGAEAEPMRALYRQDTL